MSLLEVDGLTCEFGGVRAVENLSFAVEAGTVHSVIGPNGAGKTTLFNLITGLYKPTSGRIYFEGRDVTGLPPSALAYIRGAVAFRSLTSLAPRKSAAQELNRY